VGFGTTDLQQNLQAFPRPAAYLVAYSGGLDSHVLLHAMARLRGQLDVSLRAVHVHHGLQAVADDWLTHCREVCAALDVPLQVDHLGLQPQPGQSVEAVAREARYAALAELLQDDEMLLTAQHRDDQAETLLLQLLRGAGIEGLAAMPACRPWQGGWHARPLLATGREALHAYALDHGLQWVDDPSNQDQRFDRNYLRHTVMPTLLARWPGASRTLARSASHLAGAMHTLHEVAQADLQACTGAHGCLSVSALLGLPQQRRQATLREWVRRHAVALPDQARLQEIERSVLSAGPDSSPLVTWSDVGVRRYRDQLWLLPATQGPLPATLAWPDRPELVLPAGCGRLRRTPAPAGIPDRYWKEGRVTVRWRSEGLRCRPRGREGTRSFKKLAQELGIPPWQRDRVPLLYVDGELAAVADYCLCGEPEVHPGDTFSRLHWEQ